MTVLPRAEDEDQRGPSWNLDMLVSGLRASRERWRRAQNRSRDYGLRELPSRDVLQKIAVDLCGVLFPMRLGPADLRQECEDYYVGHTLDYVLNTLLEQVKLELRCTERLGGCISQKESTKAAQLVQNFAITLPGIRDILDQDILAAYKGDPAAHSVDEVLLCYPGVQAIIYHRLAHCLFSLGLTLIPRILSEISHSLTGVDIHPGATIGPGFFIDHGTGVVIGETAVIGRGVRMYQAVTLGAKHFPTDADGSLKKGLPRHPIVEDDVVLYAGATILGRITVGQGSTIGGNVWLTRSVPPGSHVTQANSRHEIME